MNPIQKPITYLTLALSLLGTPTYSLAGNYEKEAYQTFVKILKINTNQPIHLVARAVDVYIQKFADKIGNQDNYASPEELKIASQELNGISGKVADQYFGNKNSKTELEEMNKLNSQIERYPGLAGILFADGKYNH